MLIRFGFRLKKLYICIAKKRRPINTGFSPFFCSKSGISTSEIEKFTYEIKNFSGSGGFFSGQVR